MLELCRIDATVCIRLSIDSVGNLGVVAATAAGAAAAAAVGRAAAALSLLAAGAEVPILDVLHRRCLLPVELMTIWKLLRERVGACAYTLYNMPPRLEARFGCRRVQIRVADRALDQQTQVADLLALVLRVAAQVLYRLIDVGQVTAPAPPGSQQRDQLPVGDVRPAAAAAPSLTAAFVTHVTCA